MDTTDEFRPKSTKAALWKQVEEQSKVCDFTVKVGAWVKRFHSSILMASPFFQCMIDGQYRLCKPAIVEFRNTSFPSVEMAIMYLYEKCPEVNRTKIHELLDLAEFLMIPNLKALCVSLARRIPVNKSNVITQLQLASMYEFDIPRATEYFHSHLDDLLADDSLIQASNDLIADLFANKTLRYVSMDTRLQFLIRWTQYNITDRNRLFPELFALLDHTELSEGILQEATTGLGIHGCMQTLSLNNRLQRSEVIAIIPRRGYQQSIWYDICNDQWLKPQVSLNTPSSYAYNSCVFAHSIQSSCYGVCYSSNIEIVDVSKNTCRTVVLSKTSKSFASVCANATTVVAYIFQHVQIRKNKNKILRGVLRRTFYRSMLFQIGKLDEKTSNVMMEPVFTINSTDNAKLYINEAHVCAIVFKQNILMFDTVSYQVDMIEFKAMKQCHIVPLGNGFVIHDDTKAICLQRVFGPSLDCRYILRDYDLPQYNDEILVRIMNYRLIGNIWFRQLNRRDDCILERCSERFCLRSITDLSTLTWKQCTMPSTIPLDIISSETTALMLTVPTQTVRCHVDCPHCKELKQGDETFRRYEFDNELRIYSWESDDEESEDEQFRSYDEADHYNGSDYGYYNNNYKYYGPVYDYSDSDYDHYDYHSDYHSDSDHFDSYYNGEYVWSSD